MPMGIGPGLSVTRFESVGWFDSSAYADLAAIADFNNDRYALPAFGPELVVNGDFASGTTGWVAGNGSPTFAVVGGELVSTATQAGGTSRVSQAIACTPGSTYRVRATIRRGTTTGDILFMVSDNSLLNGAFASSNAVQTTAPTLVEFYFTARLATQYVGINDTVSSAIGATSMMDNVSVREVILTRGAAALGANLAASGYTMSVNGGTGTATESPTGQLNLTGDGTNPATGDKSFTTVVGRRYRFILNTTQNVGAYIGTSAGGSQISPATTGGAGFFSYEFTATTTTTWVRFQRTAATLATVTAIEIRELPAIGSYPKRGATFAEWMAFTAASTTARSYVASDGLWKNDLAANAPRLDFRNSKRQLRLEDARTNVIRNNSMSGAVAGSPGTLPTNWGGLPGLGIGLAEVSLATINGLPAIGLRATGTASGTGGIILTFDIGNGIAASVGQVWAQSLFVALTVNSGATPAGFLIRSQWLTGAGAVISSSDTAVSLTTSLTRYEGSGTAPATTGFVQPSFRFGVATGLSYDFTLWIAAPQLELGAFASDPITTTSAAVTRAIETARFSPLLEAIMQRAAASVVVRGRLDAVPVGATPRVVGGNGGVALIGGAGSGTIVGSYNGTASISATVPSSGNIVSPFGATAAFDSSGRTVGVNGALSGGDTATIGDRAQVLLARAVYIGGSSEYGHGLYDFVGISPERLSNATLQALAVPA